MNAFKKILDMLLREEQQIEEHINDAESKDLDELAELWRGSREHLQPQIELARAQYEQALEWRKRK